MLSISARNASGSGIRAYLEGERDGANRGPEDYYAEAGQAAGEWLGSSAESLGLSGAVRERPFDALAAGFDPGSGQPLVRRTGESHRPGWDFTFSAPKSVSVVWGVAQQPEREGIEGAHRDAVRRTLAFAEEQGLFITRRGKDGIERERAKPIIAAYLHGTSREADPQLHTHAFVMNVAQRADGGFGTLETKPLYQWKMALGAAYRAELAHRLRALGYEIESDAKGSFRMKDVARDIERHFSKRRVQIEAALAERGTASAKAAEVAALDTRKAKEAVSASTLRAQWREAAAALGFAAERAGELRGDPAHIQRAIDTLALIERLTTEHSTFTTADLTRAAADAVQMAGGGLARTREVAQAIAKDAEVIALGPDRYSTRAMLAIERGALARAQHLAGDGEYRVNLGASAAAA